MFTEDELIKISVLCGESKANIIEGERYGPLTSRELETIKALESIEYKIDAKLIKMHQLRLIEETQKHTSLRLVHDEKKKI